MIPLRLYVKEPCTMILYMVLYINFLSYVV